VYIIDLLYICPIGVDTNKTFILNIMRKKKKLVFIALRKSDNRIAMSVTKVGIADHLNICTKTICRHLKGVSMYNCDKYTIWKNIEVPKRKTGFALR
jgi:hypothetical protein